jgi:hypothetical protein
MILGVRGADELETQDITVGTRLGPDDLRMLHRLMVRRRANAKHTNLPDRHAHIHGHT